MARSKSSKGWLQEHFSDVYVKKAQKEGFRSRAAYKLLEIQQKDQLIRPGMVVVDLGAAPGGWTQVITQLLKGQGKIFALDRLPMDPFEDVTFIQGDFTEQAVYDELQKELGAQRVDLVLSDMAPNLSGNKHVDQPRMMALLEICLDFAQNHLKAGGSFLVKAFHGEGFETFLKTTRTCFQKVVIRKPDASRSRSKEVYILACGLKKTAMV